MGDRGAPVRAVGSRRCGSARHAVVPARPNRRRAGARAAALARAGGHHAGDRRAAPSVSERSNRIASAALALVGVGITAYLLSVRVSGATLSCTTGGCETVQNSPYSEIFGLPVAALGLIGYVVLLGAALARGDLAQTHRRGRRPGGVRVQCLPRGRSGGRDRRALRLVPRERCSDDRARRTRAPSAQIAWRQVSRVERGQAVAFALEFRAYAALRTNPRGFSASRSSSTPVAWSHLASPFGTGS